MTTLAPRSPRIARPGPGHALVFHIRSEGTQTQDGLLAGRLVRALEDAGAEVTSVTSDIGEHGDDPTVRLECNTNEDAEPAAMVSALKAVDGVVDVVSEDVTFALHQGGKLSVAPKVTLRSRSVLSQVYTPGVARVCRAIQGDPSLGWDLTVKGNTVAVVSDGSAVLGLGDIGPVAALPVMEGKAMLFQQLAGVDAWPVVLATQEVDEIVQVVKAIAPGYGGINLEDIAAPRCFEIERRLREELDIPVFHDDQHGTAVVVLAALTNALELTGRSLAGSRIVVSGVGAAGTAIVRLLQTQGAVDVVASDRVGVLSSRRTDLTAERRELAERTNPRDVHGSLADALVDADVFIGVSAPGLLRGDDIARMSKDAIVFALANPDPEVDPRDAARHAAVVATGRSDYPNQINNVLAFPGLFRGMLDVRARTFSDEVLVAAAGAIAAAVPATALSAACIVPSVFDPAVAPAVAAAVRAAAAGDTSAGEVWSARRLLRLTRDEDLRQTSEVRKSSSEERN